VRPDAADWARNLIVLCDAFEEVGFKLLASRGRMVARDLLEAVDELAAARSATDAIRKRHDDYVAYHQAHCFKPDGTTRSGVKAAAFREAK